MFDCSGTSGDYDANVMIIFISAKESRLRRMKYPEYERAPALQKLTMTSLSVTSIFSVILKNIYTSVLMSCRTRFWNASTDYKKPGVIISTYI